jgi:prolipoprotein diacylglyceryltransferase
MLCYSFGKVGCWRLGCCSAPGMVLSLPLQLFESVMAAVVSLLLVAIILSGVMGWRPFAFFLTAHGVLRMYAKSRRQVLGISFLFTLLFALVGLVLLSVP